MGSVIINILRWLVPSSVALLASKVPLGQGSPKASTLSFHDGVLGMKNIL